MERIDKLIVHMGQYSRSEVRNLVRHGQVTLNGQVVRKEDEKADPLTDKITISGQQFLYREFTYLIMNKPSGVLTATEDKRAETVLDLLPKSARVQDLAPVGRLDKDTEGLLLLTNDGVLAHALLSPRHHVDKTYYVEVNGQFVPQDTVAVAQGIHMQNGEVFQSGTLEIIDDHSAYLTIQEGKFHQVKKMMLALGKEVTYLQRVSMGPLRLDETLAKGKFRYLSDEETELLKTISKKEN